MEESWPTFWPNRWVVERCSAGKMIQREIPRALFLNLLWQSKRCSSLPRISLSLTAPSLLSRRTRHQGFGWPAFEFSQWWASARRHPGGASKDPFGALDLGSAPGSAESLELDPL